MQSVPWSFVDMGRQGVRALLLLCSLVFTGVQGGNFSCFRPTTPCHPWNGQCQPDGVCYCNNRAWGLRCDVPPTVLRNGGSCLVHNQCVRGTCFDDGVVTHCDCPDGYYGTKCEHMMVYAECNAFNMIVNILPYGYDHSTWFSAPPLTGVNYSCALDPINTFFTNHPEFRASSHHDWKGFGGIFLHQGDKCAGDPDIVYETATKVTYSRTFYIGYSTTGRNPSDETVRPTCTAIKPPPPPATRPPPRVKISYRTPQGLPARGPFKLGAKLHVHFVLNIPNSGGFDDAQVETCTLMDGITRRYVNVVEKSCALPPVGQLLYKNSPGKAVLIMAMHTLPGMNSNLRFSCKVRVCRRTIDTFCSTPAPCQPRTYNRGKRSADEAASSEGGHFLTVESALVTA